MSYVIKSLIEYELKNEWSFDEKVIYKIVVEDLYDFRIMSPLVHELRLVYSNVLFFDGKLYNVLLHSLYNSVMEEKKLMIHKLDDNVVYLTNILLIIIINAVTKYTNKTVVLSRQTFILGIADDYFQLIKNISIYKKKSFLPNDADTFQKFMLFFVYELERKGVIKLVLKRRKIKTYINIEFTEKMHRTSFFLEHNVLFDTPKIKFLDDHVIIGGHHYMNNYNIMSKNSWQVEKKNVTSDPYIRFIEKYSAIPLFVDYEMIPFIYEIYEIKSEKSIRAEIENFKIVKNTKTRIFKLFKLSEYSSFGLFIKNEIEKSPDIKKSFSEWRAIENLNITEQKKLSENLELLLFTTFVNYVSEYRSALYFIGFSDFRGRNYHRSRVSPYASNLFRFLYNYGSYSEIKKDKKSIMNKYIYLLDANTSYPIQSLWVYLSLGAILKKYVTYKPIIKYEEMISLGISYRTYLGAVKKKELVEIKYYELILKNLKGDVEKKKRYLSKDSTASIFQHLTKILGLKNNEHTKFLNITDEFIWYDTYYVFLEEIDNAVKDMPHANIVNREVLKKVIMTCYYSASYPTLWDSFKEKVCEEHGNQFLSDNYHELSMLFKVIYRALPAAELKLYKKTVKTLVLETKKEILIKDQKLVLEDITIDLRYYKSIPQRKDYMKNGVRKTITYNINICEINNRKTYSAFVPNIVHAFDSSFVREVSGQLNVHCIVIHDAFLIDFDRVDLLITVAKKTININKKFILCDTYINPNSTKIKIKSNSILI